MTILLTGGCGYIGSVLTRKLLEKGHELRVVDTQWFGNFLDPHPRLQIIKDDIRHCEIFPLHGIDVIIHLANIANDPCADLNPLLSWHVNVLATMRLADSCARNGVKQFIHASSGSVYGLSDAPKVTEDLPLKPISAYNETKMIAERVLLSYSEKMSVQIVRPGTVCGVSPRMRLDLLVNMLSMQALAKGEITVLGGEQTRPAIHMDDMTDVYIFLLEHPEIRGIFNASFENISVAEVAKLVIEAIPAKMKTAPTNDPRSYRMNSDKIIAAGFHPKKTVKDAIREIKAAFDSGSLKDEEHFYNIKWMKRLSIKP